MKIKKNLRIIWFKLTADIFQNGAKTQNGENHINISHCTCVLVAKEISWKTGVTPRFSGKSIFLVRAYGVRYSTHAFRTKDPEETLFYRMVSFTGYSFWDQLRIFYTNLHELFCQLISWTNRVNSGKFMDNCWISCQVMADVKKVYDAIKLQKRREIQFSKTGFEACVIIDS